MTRKINKPSMYSLHPSTSLPLDKLLLWIPRTSPQSHLWSRNSLHQHPIRHRIKRISVIPNLHTHNILLIPHNRPVHSFHTPVIQLSICDAVAGIGAAEGEVRGGASVRKTDICARAGKVVRRPILHRSERGAREARDERGA